MNFHDNDREQQHFGDPDDVEFSYSVLKEQHSDFKALGHGMLRNGCQLYFEVQDPCGGTYCHCIQNTREPPNN